MRPLKSHISSFSMKYHIAFCHLRLLRGLAIDLILFHKHGFWTLASGLKSHLRLEKSYCKHSECHWPGQGNFYKEDNDLKLIRTWELAHLPKPPESHLNVSVDFISGLKFWSRTNSDSWQNSRSIGVLHVFVVSVLAEHFKRNLLWLFITKL